MLNGQNAKDKHQSGPQGRGQYCTHPPLNRGIRAQLGGKIAEGLTSSIYSSRHAPDFSFSRLRIKLNADAFD